MLIYNLHSKEQSLNKYLNYTVKLDFEDETKNLNKKETEQTVTSTEPRTHTHKHEKEATTASD